MNKPAVSKATQSIVDVNKDLSKLLAQVKHLTKENTDLKKQLADTRRELAQLKHKTGVSLKKVVKNVKGFGTGKQVKIKSISYQQTTEAKERAEKMKGMSKKEQKAFLKSDLYIPRFIERLHIVFAGEWDYSWDADIKLALAQLSPAEIFALMRMLGLEKMYYESDSSYDYEEPEDLTAQEVYNYIILEAQGRYPEMKFSFTATEE